MATSTATQTELCLYTSRAGRTARYTVVGRFRQWAGGTRRPYARIKPADWIGDSFVVREQDIRPVGTNQPASMTPPHSLHEASMAPPAGILSPVVPAASKPALKQLTAFASDLGWTPGQVPTTVDLDISEDGEDPLHFTYQGTDFGAEGDAMAFRYTCGGFALTVFND